MGIQASSSGPPEWHRVNTFSLGRGYSPHYRYHGAIAQIKTLEMLDQMVKIDPSARAQIANRVLELWQQGSYIPAEQYLYRLSEIIMNLHDQGVKEISLHHLPRDQEFPESVPF